jgi:predicted RNA-binding protein with TRAM domain
VWETGDPIERGDKPPLEVVRFTDAEDGQEIEGYLVVPAVV